MGTTRFKLFSSTGPSVALGLAIAVIATVTLTPALLVFLARAHPRAFNGLAANTGVLWERLGRHVMARPMQSWVITLLVMLPLSVLGLSTHFVQDLMTELPSDAPSANDFRLVASKFEPGMLAPLTVVLAADTDLHGSQGLALIDDVSRFLTHQRMLTEVRSATQPLGSPRLLERTGSRAGWVKSTQDWAVSPTGPVSSRPSSPRGLPNSRAPCFWSNSPGFRSSRGRVPQKAPVRARPPQLPRRRRAAPPAIARPATDQRPRSRKKTYCEADPSRRGGLIDCRWRELRR